MFNALPEDLLQSRYPLTTTKLHTWQEHLFKNFVWERNRDVLTQAITDQIPVSCQGVCIFLEILFHNHKFIPFTSLNFFVTNCFFNWPVAVSFCKKLIVNIDYRVPVLCQHSINGFLGSNLSRGYHFVQRVKLFQWLARKFIDQELECPLTLIRLLKTLCFCRN